MEASVRVPINMPINIRPLRGQYSPLSPRRAYCGSWQNRAMMSHETRVAMTAKNA
jgi:hypothetical protein